LKKLLRKTNITIAANLFIAVTFITGCGKEKLREDFIARVNQSYLTAENLSADLGTSGLQLSHRNEYIRNWIETELLYKAALKEGIPGDEEYQRILNKSKKELAKAFLINRLLTKEPVEFKPEEPEAYYNSHKSDFRLFHDAYHYNSIIFNDEDKAILFRGTLIESDWNKTANIFHNEKSILAETPDCFENDYQIQPRNLFAIMQDLQPNEAGIVLNTEPDRFMVVQLIRKYRQNEIPEFDVIRVLVKERFLMEKRGQIARNYVKNLYAKYEVELKSGK